MVDFNQQFLKGKKSAATATFSEDEIQMPKSSIKGVVPALVGIDVNFTLSPDGTTPFVASKYHKWRLCTKSNDSLPEMEDAEVICGGDNFEPAVIVGHDSHWRITFPAPIPITSDKLYFQCLQDSGATNLFNYNISWVPRYIRGIQQQQQVQTFVQF